MCPTCPSVPEVTCVGPSKAHLPTSATLTGPAHKSGIRPVIHRRTTWRGSHLASGFLSPFGNRHLLLGHPIPAKGIRPSSRSAHPAS